MRSVLSVRDLTITFPGPNGPNPVARSVSLEIAPGETVGLVGESGCGKTITALSILGLLPRKARVDSGSIRYGDRELLGAPEQELRRVRGAEIGMIFQEPSTSLHPTLPIGFQIAEAIEAHHPDTTAAQRRRRAVELLGQVGVPDPRGRVDDYPHTWSGGMRQRAVIAMAIANDPKILIADEPTTALDVTIQAQVLELLARLLDRTGAALLLISHDFGIIGEMADRVEVMYAGRIVESSPAPDVYRVPRHPYTAGLIESIPRVDGVGTRLPFIPGRPPHVSSLPPGCLFEPRCKLAEPRCSTIDPPLAAVGPDARRLSACLFPERVRLSKPSPTATSLTTTEGRGSLLQVDGLRVHFRTGRGRRPRLVRAVDGVSFSIGEGETLAVVGESGCGKTTTARALLRLVEPTAGTIRFRGTALEGLGDRALKEARRHIQGVFQDPYASLNPRKRVADIIASPLRIHDEGDSHAISARVSDLLGMVGLGDDLADRFPAELSGGQRQRVSIARALALEPALLVLDEPLSSLDVSIQAQVINLLQDLQQTLGVSYLFIAHNLAVVRHLAQRVAVMYMGRIVETGNRDSIFDRPSHPYTRALLSAVPAPEPGASGRPRIVLEGDVPDPAEQPVGCRFMSRCYQAQADCVLVEPELGEVVAGCACFYPITEPPPGRLVLS